MQPFDPPPYTASLVDAMARRLGVASPVPVEPLKTDVDPNKVLEEIERAHEP